LNLRKETLMMYTNASPTVWLEGSVFTASSADSLTRTGTEGIAHNFTLPIASSSVVHERAAWIAFGFNAGRTSCMQFTDVQCSWKEQLHRVRKGKATMGLMCLSLAVQAASPAE
jgi:hypothetical protein